MSKQPDSCVYSQEMAEARRRAMSSLFEILEANSEGTVIVDAEARVVWMNMRYAERFGSTVESAVGRPVEEVIPGSRMRAVVQSGRPVLLDIMRTTGEPLVVVRLPLKDDDGSVVGAVGFALFDELKKLSPLVAAFGKIHEELKIVREALAHERQSRYCFSSFAGASQSILDLKAQAAVAATLDAPVLITGETGTGKELLAHAVHGASLRAHGPLVSINMAAIPEALLEAEFFGAAPGAYTGMGRKGRVGKLQVAEGGTLFLDEIGDLPVRLQGKLLRVLQEKEYEPLGSNRVLRADIRIIAATSADLPQLMADKLFRADLYYRLNVLPLHIPPLRERSACMRVLCIKMLQDIAERSKSPMRRLTDKAVDTLRAYSWPGNVRELRNILERAAMATGQTDLCAANIAALLPGGPARPVPPSPGSGYDSLHYETAMNSFERDLMEKALEAASGRVPKAAKLLGIGRSTLYKRMARLGIISK